MFNRKLFSRRQGGLNAFFNRCGHCCRLHRARFRRWRRQWWRKSLPPRIHLDSYFASWSLPRVFYSHSYLHWPVAINAKHLPPNGKDISAKLFFGSITRKFNRLTGKFSRLIRSVCRLRSDLVGLLQRGHLRDSNQPQNGCEECNDDVGHVQTPASLTPCVLSWVSFVIFGAAAGRLGVAGLEITHYGSPWLG